MMLRSMAAPMEGSQSQSQSQSLDAHQTRPMRRKRKADGQDNNERLHKRLSLLNLEQNGPRLYVPVENPTLPAPPSSSTTSGPTIPEQPENDSMQLDDSKYKVYIYDLDDELSSESEPEDGRLVFLPDIEKHLRSNRIPPSVLANKDGELAGMQLVLYSEPSSLTVPEERDSVRKAIIEARARVREKQREGRDGSSIASVQTPSRPSQPTVVPQRSNNHTGGQLHRNPDPWTAPSQDDPDAMELD